jgi:hypothetical protein
MARTPGDPVAAASHDRPPASFLGSVGGRVVGNRTAVGSGIHRPITSPQPGFGDRGRSAEVPKVPLRAWLCRPGARDISLSLFAQESLEFRVAWGLAGRSRPRHSEWLRLEAGQTRVVPMTGLQVDRSYAYTVASRGGASGDS